MEDHCCEIEEELQNQGSQGEIGNKTNQKLNKTNIIYKDQSDLKISENLQSTAKFNKPENRNLSSVAANKMMFKHVEFNDSSSSDSAPESKPELMKPPSFNPSEIYPMEIPDYLKQNGCEKNEVANNQNLSKEEIKKKDFRIRK